MTIPVDVGTFTFTAYNAFGYNKCAIEDNTILVIDIILQGTSATQYFDHDTLLFSMFNLQDTNSHRTHLWCFRI